MDNNGNKAGFLARVAFTAHSPFGCSRLQRYNAAQIAGEQCAYDSWCKSAICDEYPIYGAHT
jgi:hypothetical protein